MALSYWFYDAFTFWRTKGAQWTPSAPQGSSKTSPEHTQSPQGLLKALPVSLQSARRYPWHRVVVLNHWFPISFITICLFVNPKDAYYHLPSFNIVLLQIHVSDLCTILMCLWIVTLLLTLLHCCSVLPKAPHESKTAFPDTPDAPTIHWISNWFSRKATVNCTSLASAGAAKRLQCMYVCM